MPIECWNAFLDGDKTKCITYLIKYKNMTKDEAVRVYDEYRKKIMKSNKFCSECVNAKRNPKVYSMVKPKIPRNLYRDIEIAEMFNSGMTLAEISYETDIHTKALRKIIDGLGIELRPRIREWSPLDQHKDVIIKYLSEGRLIKDIAPAVGAHPGTLSHYIRRRKLRELVGEAK